MDASADPKMNIERELLAARAAYHALLDSLSADDFRRPSRNPAWTNGEIMAHIAFGFVIVDTLLPLARLFASLPPGFSRAFAWLLDHLNGPFNRINAWGARGQGRVFNRGRVGAVYDRAQRRLLRRAGRMPAGEWRRGMHYPARWDPNFKAFMTLEDLFQYPAAHQRLHVDQISPATS